MDKIFVSPSRLKTFLDCKWAYYCNYILKLPNVGSPKTILGSCIHELFELISTPLKQDKRKKYIFYSMDNGTVHPVISRLFKKLLKKHKVPQFDKKNFDLHEFGGSLILNTFERGYDPHVKILAVEKEFQIQMSDKVWIKGFIDKVSELSSDTIELTDYKSGQPFSQEQCETEYQPFFYLIAAKFLYPNYKNYVFNFHFLKNKKTKSVAISDTQLNNFIPFIIAQGILMLKFTEKDAIYNKSFKCSCMCSFQKPIKELNYKGCPGFYVY